MTPCRQVPQQEGQVKGDVVAYHDAAGNKLPQSRRIRCEVRSVGNVLVRQAVNPGGGRRNGRAWVDQLIEPRLIEDFPAQHRNGANLYHPLTRYVEPRRFKVEHNGRKCSQRSMVRGPQITLHNCARRSAHQSTENALNAPRNLAFEGK